MAGGTILAVLTLMDILIGVTGEAITRSIFIDPGDMTGFAFRVDVRPCQWKAGRIVIELSGLPCGGRMALFANRTELTHVWIVLFMAGKTIQRSAFKNAIHVTLLASYLYVSAVQLENRAIVIEARGSPPFGRMTRSAVLSQASQVRIVFRVAGDTIPAGALQGSQRRCPCMALSTLHIGMFAGQFEIELVVIEIIAETI